MKIEQHPEWNPPKVDKRKKAYKEYKAAFEAKNSKGLGDVVESITEVTGIKKAVKFLKGEDCGCEGRKEKLNKRFRFPLLNCPTEEMYNTLHEYFSKPQRSDISGPQQDEFNSILEHVFKRKFRRVSCCYGSRLQELKQIYSEYQE